MRGHSYHRDSVGLSKTNVELSGVPDASRVHAQRRSVGCGVDGEDAGERALGLLVVDAEASEGVFHVGVSKERHVVADLFERVEIGVIRCGDVVEDQGAVGAVLEKAGAQPVWERA